MPTAWLRSSGQVRHAALNYLAPRAGCTLVSSGCRAPLREDWAGLEPSSSAESLLHPPLGSGWKAKAFFHGSQLASRLFRPFWPLSPHHRSLSKLPPFPSSKAGCSWGAGQSWGRASPAPWLPRVKAARGRVGVPGQQKSQELDFSLLSLTTAALGGALISQAAERLGVAPDTGEIRDFESLGSGCLPGRWCPSTLALASWHSRVSRG